MRALITLILFCLPVSSWATPAVTLVHCTFHHYGNGKYGLIMAYAAIGRDFQPHESIRMAGWNSSAFVHTGACMRFAGTSGAELEATTVETSAEKIDGFNSDCLAQGKGVQMGPETRLSLKRGTFVEVASHDYKTGQPQILLHTYFMRYDELDKDLGAFPGQYCRKVMPKAIEQPVPAGVRLLVN